MDRIDFRSDTVTWPTPAMREAMAHAEVGDDVYGEDPTVNRLEEMAAACMGKEAALFMTSGTMGNLAAILSHAGRGDEAILGIDAHVFQWEAGNMAALGGVTPRPLSTDEQGRFDPAELEGAVREDDPHLPRSRLILVENTYAARCGAPLEPSYFSEVRKVAVAHGLAVHLDGARLFNAAAALGLEPAALTRDVDSVSFCLSKALCAPAGSLLCGSSAFIDQARRARKSLGGGMRQAGILAAAGIMALEEMTARLVDDHAQARRIADGLAGIPGVRIDPTAVRTNIVYFHLEPESAIDGKELASRLQADHGIWIDCEAPRKLRAVTHYWVGEKQVDALLAGVQKILG